MLGIALAMLLFACSNGSAPPADCCPVKVTPSGPLVLSPAAILRHLAKEYAAAIQRDLTTVGSVVPIVDVRVVRVRRLGKLIVVHTTSGLRPLLLAMGRAMDASLSDRFIAQGIRRIGIQEPGGRSYVQVGVLRRYAAGSISRRELISAVGPARSTSKP
jgi:hypothetical protein